MKKVFILQNQDNLFLNRHSEWVEGREAASLFKTPHKDEAVNQVFEVSSKDYTQRVQILGCKVNDKNIPQIPDDALPTFANAEGTAGDTGIEPVDEPAANDGASTATTAAPASSASAMQAGIKTLSLRDRRRQPLGKMRTRALRRATLKRRL